ncbi:MAG: V-type ATP synthase subunit D [Nitrospirae bacterium]|nr:V-type ATP synthase subunit D [Nitrospirota bacterium]
MIQLTRTNLLMLREKAGSVINSMRILKARKQILIREFLDTTRPFLRSRAEIRSAYGRAIQELALSLGREGKDSIESIAAVATRPFEVKITEKRIWGLRYKEVTASEPAVRAPWKRGYDFLPTSPHLDEGINLFEKIMESMIEMAAFESKLKRLGEEIVKTSRRIRVLEEKVLPEFRSQIKMISDHISEGEREAFCGLKRFKEKSRSARKKTE